MATYVSPQPPRLPRRPSAPVNKTPFRGEKERRRKEVLERVILGLTFGFCGFVVFAVWYSDGKILEAPTKFLERFAPAASLQSRDFAQNCRDPKNKNTPYCQERTAEIESNWMSMSRTQGGKTGKFTLHEKY